MGLSDPLLIQTEQDRAVTPRSYPYPTLRQLLVLSLLVLPFLQIVMLPLVENPSSFLSLAIAELLLLMVAVLAIRRHRWSAEDLFLLNAARVKGLIIVVPTALAAGLLAGEIDLEIARWWQWIEWTPPLSLRRSTLEIQILTDAADVLPAVIVIGLLPAVCEELFFRGFVYTGLRYHHGPNVAVIGSALLFAIAHLNPWQLPTFFLLGLFLSWLVHRTHSIYPAVIAHALNNLLSVCAVNVRVHSGSDPLGALEPASGPILVGAFATFVMGIWLLRRIRPIMPALSPFATSALRSHLARGAQP